MAEQEEKLPLKEILRMLFKASKGFWLVNVVNFGDGIAYFGILNLMTLFLGLKGLGMPDDLVSWSVSLFTGLVTLFMFGGGFISDRIGVRRALTLCLVMLLGGRLMLVFAADLSPAPLAAFTLFGTNILLSPSFLLCWAGLLIMAFGEGVIQPALYAGVKEYTDARTATMSYSILYAIMNLGIIMESFVSPYIRTDAAFIKVGGREVMGLGLGISGVFWLCIAATLAMLLVHLGFFTAKVEAKDRMVTDAPVEPDAKPKTFSEKLKELPFLDARFMFFIFALLPVRTLFAHQWLTMPDYIMRCYPAAVGAKYEWITALNPIIIVIFVPLIAAFTRKVNVVTMMIIGTAISAVTTFLLVPGPNLTALLAYVILFSFGEAVWSSRFLEYVADIAPAGRVGAYMGLAGIPWFLAKFTTGLYSGKVLAAFVPAAGPQDSSTMWLIYALIACVTPLILILARRWLTAPLAAAETKA
ncbi:MAG TPA: MFS transporter [Elusimicrobiales bacterium]|nr:MFS transporter [Elusimicrobiales bacterium]